MCYFNILIIFLIYFLITYRFDVDDPDFFTQSLSIAIVHFILERQRFSDDTETANDIGVEKLLNDGVYQAAYPLHDVSCTINIIIIR